MPAPVRPGFPRSAAMSAGPAAAFCRWRRRSCRIAQPGTRFRSDRSNILPPGRADPAAACQDNPRGASIAASTQAATPLAVGPVPRPTPFQQRLPTLMPFDPLPGLVQSESAGPGRERSGRVIGVELFPKRQGRLLHDVFGVLDVGNEGRHVAVDFPLAAQEQREKTLLRRGWIIRAMWWIRRHG
jgi:hypothetical protein